MCLQGSANDQEITLGADFHLLHNAQFFINIDSLHIALPCPAAQFPPYWPRSMPPPPPPRPAPPGGLSGAPPAKLPVSLSATSCKK